MPDLNEIAGRFTQALIPLLPYLLRIGDAAADEVGRRMSAAAWEQIRALWKRLCLRRSVEPVAQAVVASPDNPALREALREEIARALAEDDSLAQELARLLPQSGPAGQTVIASGERSVAIGGSVSGSVIVTGDRNDEEHRLLQVVFTSGRVYCYENVPPEVFRGLPEAESKGQYMRAHIIDVYPYRRGPFRKRWNRSACYDGKGLAVLLQSEPDFRFRSGFNPG
jgi:hypothetical protein